MRIVHVARQFPPGIGGIEEVVACLAQAQAAAGHCVRVVTLDRIFADPARRLAPRETVAGVDVRRLPFAGSTRYPLAPQALGHVRDADIVHVHAVDFFFDYFAATAPLHRKPMVATTHGGFFHTKAHAGLKKIWFDRITRLTARAYRTLVACSQADFDLFAPLRHPDLKIIENGVDVEKFAGAGARAPVKSLVTVGRFSVNKRLDRLLDAFAALVACEPGWRLSIAGAESDWNAERLAREIVQRGLGEHVRVHVRPSNAEIAEVLRQARLFVSASEHEGFGVSLIEAMSAGLSCVVEGNAAFRAFAARHADIALADFTHPRMAAQAILDAHARLERDNEALRARAIAQAQLYAWPGVARRYLDVYETARSRG